MRTVWSQFSHRLKNVRSSLHTPSLFYIVASYTSSCTTIRMEVQRKMVTILIFCRDIQYLISANIDVLYFLGYPHSVRWTWPHPQPLSPRAEVTTHIIHCVTGTANHPSRGHPHQQIPGGGRVWGGTAGSMDHRAGGKGTLYQYNL